MVIFYFNMPSSYPYKTVKLNFYFILLLLTFKVITKIIKFLQKLKIYMSLNLNKISRPNTAKRNSFFDQQLPYAQLSQQTRSIFAGCEPSSGEVVSTHIMVPSEQLQKCLKVYEWRALNPHSIVKCVWTGIYPADLKQILIETKHKKYCFTLKHLNKVSLTQCIYILTSILPSFLELHTKFGSFNFSQQNIFFDQNLNCEVWINQNPSLNFYQKAQRNQEQTVIKIIKLLEAHQLKSNIGRQFFAGVFARKQITFLSLQNYVCDFISKKQLVVKKNLIRQNFTRKCQSNISSIQSIQIRNSNKSLNLSPNQQLLSFSQKKMQRKRNFKLIKQQSTAIDIRDQSESSSNGQKITLNSSPQKMIKSLFTQYRDKKHHNKNYYSHMNQKQGVLKHYIPQNVEQDQSQNYKYHNCRSSIKFCHTSSQLQYNPLGQKVNQVSPRQINIHIQVLPQKSRQTQKFDQTNGPIHIDQRQEKYSEFQQGCQYKQNRQRTSLQSCLGDQFSSGFMRTFFSRIQQTNSRISEDQDQNQIFQNQNAKDQNILGKINRNQSAGEQQFNSIDKKDKHCKIILPNIGNMVDLDVFYRDREMSSSITMPDYLGLSRKRSQSPIKLEKLGKLKMQTTQSIIEENGFGYYDN